MWTLAEANVECRVMSGATAASADETGHAEQRDCAWGWNCRYIKHGVCREAIGGPANGLPARP